MSTAGIKTRKSLSQRARRARELFGIRRHPDAVRMVRDYPGLLHGANLLLGRGESDRPHALAYRYHWMPGSDMAEDPPHLFISHNGPVPPTAGTPLALIRPAAYSRLDDAATTHLTILEIADLGLELDLGFGRSFAPRWEMIVPAGALCDGEDRRAQEILLSPYLLHLDVDRLRRTDRLSYEDALRQLSRLEQR
ncbi:hypothetical protein [Salininema proteolyticum]|uniref:Uncharacterized protein n=1 Tax=Salininema proteolyticum TaxID=1607685 RepID=A0ABV8TWW7_9ACTN